MSQSAANFFEANSEPIEQRIAAGLHKLGVVMRRQDWLLANDSGLSPMQGQIIAAVAAAGPLRATEISSTVGVTLPTISDAVTALVDKDLVERIADPTHPRAKLVALTKRGHKTAKQVRTWPNFMAEALGELTEQERASLLTAIIKLIKSLQQSGQIPIQRMCVTCKYFDPNVHRGALPHHCRLVDAPMGDRHIRVECPEHEQAPDEQRDLAWARFIRSPGK